MEININTKFITLIGTPLNQSFAAKMQNAGYQAAGLDLVYFYSEADQTGLPHVLEGVRSMPFAGCAVTKPNKVEVMKYLDGYDPLCEKMGSSNTVVKTPEGKLIGYNTDGYGALRSLEEHAGSLKGRTVISFGAGGTGRSVCFELANAGVERLYICSRSAACEELSEQLNAFYPGVCVPVRASDTEKLSAAMKETSIVLNLSGAGMRGKEDTTCVDKALLSAGQICFDATYNPEETRFLREAREIGCKTINGLDMSLYQGARQIELWTGKEAPVEAMRKTLLDIVSNK